MIITGALLSVVFAFLSVSFLGGTLSGYDRQDVSFFPTLAAVIVAFTFLVVTTSVVIGGVAGAFGRGDARELLTTVVVSYFSLILVFASVYFVSDFFGDYQSATATYRAYRKQALMHENGPVLVDQLRSFGGIERRFWSGVDWPEFSGEFPGGLAPGSYAIDPAEMRRIAASEELPAVVRFLPEARLAIFGDCLHLSIITMTTVGYGDIWPRSLAARVAADTEALCYTILLIFAVGMIFGNVRDRFSR